MSASGFQLEKDRTGSETSASRLQREGDREVNREIERLLPSSCSTIAM
jgi:hypothetical protein